MKTVRFAQVVQRSGRPHVHALWVAPEKDPELSRARKTNRVMTIDTPAHGKADVGTVGFLVHHRPGTQFLIFPKSLAAFAGSRVVGINFDLVDQPANVPAGLHDGRALPSRGKRRHAAVVADPSMLPVRTAPEPTEPEPAAAEPTTAPKMKRRETAPVTPARQSPPKPQRRIETAPHETTQASVEPPWAKQVRAALAELHDGKTVAAYQRLDRLLAGHLPRAVGGTR